MIPSNGRVLCWATRPDGVILRQLQGRVWMTPGPSPIPVLPCTRYAGVHQEYSEPRVTASPAPSDSSTIVTFRWGKEVFPVHLHPESWVYTTYWQQVHTLKKQQPLIIVDLLGNHKGTRRFASGIITKIEEAHDPTDYISVQKPVILAVESSISTKSWTHISPRIGVLVAPQSRMVTNYYQGSVIPFPRTDLLISGEELTKHSSLIDEKQKLTTKRMDEVYERTVRRLQTLPRTSAEIGEDAPLPTSSFIDHLKTKYIDLRDVPDHELEDPAQRTKHLARILNRRRFPGAPSEERADRDPHSTPG